MEAKGEDRVGKIIPWRYAIKERFNGLWIFFKIQVLHVSLRYERVQGLENGSLQV